jgi:uncharacterized protein
MIIDTHTHAWPEKIAHKAREHLETLFGVKLIAEPTIATLQAYMKRNAIDVSVVCAVATRPEQVPSINDWLFDQRSPSIRIFAAMHPLYEDWRSELKRIHEHADGVKLQPEFQNFYIDDESVFGMYEVMQSYGLPVLFHCGQELSGTMLVRSSPHRVMAVKKQFPLLKIIAGHFGGFKLWDEVEEFLLGSDIYLDTSYFFGHVPDAQARDFIQRHRPDRLLFGTDFPLIDQKQDVEYLGRLALPDKLVQRIMSTNAQELLKP